MNGRPAGLQKPANEFSVRSSFD